MIKLIVFLGNKGQQYAKTRHNLGWIFLDSLTESLPPLKWQKKFHGEWTTLPVGGRQTHLLKPLLFMNESGRSVQAISHYFSLESEELLIVHDDIELEFSALKFQQGGGLAGHKGLRSLKQNLGNDNFYRLRLGIGRPLQGEVSSYVLSRFSPLEEALLPSLCQEARTLLEEHLGDFG
ncbi:MAG: aminoacyl-tRNA hydrolase [Sphaerochaetaceae bacterium]|nr:aminoacyl-tRNA hydrolase [Sphaerochaetaceae bacterium]